MILKSSVRTNIILMFSVCITFSILLFACSTPISTPTPYPYLGDGGFLSGETCGPPCFFGIMPGMTTMDQAITILKSEGLYQDCYMYDNSSHGGARGLACGSALWFGFQNGDVVENVSFRPSPTINVSDVIRKYGEPDIVDVSSNSPSNKEFETGMSLWYSRIGVSLGLGYQNSLEFELEPTTPILSIDYHSPNSYKLDRSYAQKWQGYGVYKEYHP